MSLCLGKAFFLSSLSLSLFFLFTWLPFTVVKIKLLALQHVFGSISCCTYYTLVVIERAALFEIEEIALSLVHCASIALDFNHMLQSP